MKVHIYFFKQVVLTGFLPVALFFFFSISGWGGKEVILQGHMFNKVGERHQALEDRVNKDV